VGLVYIVRVDYGNARIGFLTLLAKVVAVSSTEASPMVGLALKVEVPMTSVTTSIPSLTVGQEC
jgi:hypothetical protein